MPSPLNFGVFWAKSRASFLSSTPAWRDPTVLVFPTAAAEFVRNSFIPWIICSAGDVHGATLERGRSATLHEGGARKLPFSAVTTRAQCNSLSTNGHREGTKVKCKNNSPNCPSPLSLARISSWTESGPLPLNSSELVRLTRRMSASPAADGLRYIQGGGRTQDGLIHVSEDRRCCSSRHPDHRRSPTAD